MGASLDAPAPLSPVERLYDIAFREEHSISVPNDLSLLMPVQSDEQADIDISDNTFDFVRSIRVYHIQFRQHENREGDCILSDATRLGSYGTTQGDYPPNA